MHEQLHQVARLLAAQVTRLKVDASELARVCTHFELFTV